LKNKITLLLRLIAVGILLQTLFFKFTGAPESKFIFSTLGIEPWGRWLSGIFELIASVLLLVPKTQILGAVLGMGVMMGAIASHILFLGISVQGDGGLLFGLALIVFSACTLIVFMGRKQIREN
jgi:putative oxidoreductase